jgi:hypothetical protein
MRWLLAILPTRAFTVLALVLGLSAPALAAPVRVCGRATVVMPSTEAHQAWLEKEQRYGPDDAAAFADRVKRFGPRVLDTQIIITEAMGASAWFDLEGYGGLREAKVRTIKKLTCNSDAYYPLAALVGIEPRSISREALFIARHPGAYTVISLKGHPEGKPFALRLAGSGEIVCKDIRACEVAAHPRFKR